MAELKPHITFGIVHSRSKPYAPAKLRTIPWRYTQ